MRLWRLHVEGFGILQDYRLELAEGVNVLHEKNGWGKSTLAVFIKAMLYGLPATTKRSLDENERKKYAPWQGGVFGGSLEFVCARGSFRVERFFADKESGDSFALFDLATNKPSDAFSERLGEELFGIDADGFERSTYLSQRAGYASSENTSIRTKLGDLLDDVNDMGNYDTAIELLQKRRKFYQLTGNRGAIAQEEKRLSDLRAELEVCLRAEQNADQKREALKACNAQIGAAEREEGALAKKREMLVRARERMAQMEERGRMLAELSELDARKKQTEAIFCGMIPSEEELSAAKQTMDDLRNANAALRAIPEVSPDAEEMKALHDLFAGKGLPRRDEIGECIAENERLLRLRERKIGLEEELNAIPRDARFASGIPTPEDFEASFTALAEIDRLGTELVRVEAEGGHLQSAASKRRRTRMAIGCTVGAVGAVLASAFLWLSGTVGAIVAIAGAVMLLFGIVFAAVSAKKTEEQRIAERLARVMGEKKRAQEARRAAVESFLARCATSAEGDLSRTLTELSVAAVQSREGLRRRRILRDQITENARTAEQIKRRIEQFLSVYTEKTAEADFASSLNSLLHDAQRYAALRREDMRRAEQRTNAAARCEELRVELRPFLKRYDPKGARGAEEVLRSVSEAHTEYRGLCEEYRRRDAALRAFVAEKQLDRPATDEEIDADKLALAENEIKLRLEELRGQRTRLSMEIERLADDTDRIPELEAMVASTEERVKTYTKNCKTVVTAERFLTEAKEGLSTRYLSGMQERFLHYLSKLIGEEVPESVLDSSFDVSVRAYGKSRSMESFSRGMRDAIRFCVRLSLTEELAKESEIPFLLLDDPFVNLDEEHLAAARGLLQSLAEQYQIIHMVCHEGRA